MDNTRSAPPDESEEMINVNRMMVEVVFYFENLSLRKLCVLCASAVNKV
jgi:hypothetical protein